MNTRQGLCLHALLETNEFLTCEQLANILNCSEKTIRTDIKSLDAFLEHEKFLGRIITKRGAGVKLVLSQSETDKLFQTLKNNKVFMHPQLSRLSQEMVLLICTPPPHTLNTLAKSLFINKQQVQADLHWWKGMLSTHQITLTSGRTITLEGDEWKVRRLLISLLLSFSAPRVSALMKLACKVSSSYEQAFYERSLQQLQDNQGIHLSKNASWQLKLYITIMFSRIYQERTLDSYDRKRSLSCPFLKLKKSFERHLGCTLPDAELFLLQDMFACCTWQSNSKNIGQHDYNPTACQLCHDIVKALETRFDHPVPHTLLKPLTLLLENGLMRTSCGFSTLNPHEKLVKFDNMDSFCLLFSLLSSIPTFKKANFYGSSLVSIILLLIPFLEQSGYLRCYRAGLVVNSGIELALYGKHRIESCMPRVQVSDFITEDEARSASKTGDYALRQRFDFLISFYPLTLTFPSVFIAKSIRSQDIQRIASSIPSCTSPHKAEVVQTLAPLENYSWEDATQILYQDLHRCGALSASFSYKTFASLCKVLAFIKGRTIIITLHCHAILQTCIHLYSLQKTSHLMGLGSFSFAILVVCPQDAHELTPIIAQFKKLLAEQADITSTSEDEFFILR